MLPSDVSPIIMDVESTGLTAHSKITAVGLQTEFDFQILFNGEVTDQEQLQHTVREHPDAEHHSTVNVTEYEDERELLLDLTRILDKIVIEDTDAVTMYRGYHSYKEAFDYPLIQTRAFAHNVDNPLKNKPLLDIDPLLENVAILKEESIEVEDAFRGRGGLNKAPVIQFATELEEFYTEYLYENYEQLQIESARKTITEADTVIDVLDEIAITEQEAYGLQDNDWAEGSTKSDIVDSLQKIEPIFDIPEINDFILNWFEENEFDIPLKDASSLSDTYEMLKSLRGEPVESIDPLNENGEEAVHAYENGDHIDVSLHLLNDLIMTKYVTDFVLESTVSSDFYVKTV